MNQKMKIFLITFVIGVFINFPASIGMGNDVGQALLYSIVVSLTIATIIVFTLRIKKSEKKN